MTKIRLQSFLIVSKQLLIVILLVVYCFSCQKTALPNATIDECLSLEFIGNFPAQINECSGFFFEQERLHIINDGGGGTKLFSLNPNQFTDIDSLSFNNIENKDWEAILSTDQEIIIGDFGNNFGTRKDLVIYHLDKQTKLLNAKIELKYPDQSNFELSYNHNFDCEAFLILNDQYYLFSKNRGNKNTYIYHAPLYSNEFILKDSIAVPALITDATYYEEKQWILLLGNELEGGVFKSYLSIIRFDETGQLAILTHLKIKEEEQFEAITQKDENVFYLGSEKEQEKGGNLYELTLNCEEF